MKTLHVFGNPVECSDCHNLVSAVWAVDQEAAAGGAGLCPTCQVKPHPGDVGAVEAVIEDGEAEFVLPPRGKGRKLTDG